MELVPRPTLSVADTHGSFLALDGNLDAARAIKRNGDWNMPNCDLVLHGDHLVDRRAGDEFVLNWISNLRAQVVESGGQCITLMGNHEMTGIQSLAAMIGGDGEIIPKRIDQHRGLLEYAEWTTTYSGQESAEKMMQLRNAQVKSGRPDTFLDELKQHELGIKLIQHLTSLQLVAKSGSVLFTHTPPVPEMLDVLLAVSIEDINAIFQKGIRRCLRASDESISQNELTAFYRLVDIFLAADNRANKLPSLDDPRWGNIQNTLSTNTFVFGHDWDSAGIKTCPSGVSLVGLDTGFGLYAISDVRKRSSAWLYPDGRIEEVVAD